MKITIGANNAVGNVKFSKIAQVAGFSDVSNTANAAYNQANLAYTQANLAVVNVSSGNTSNLIISGNASNVIIDTCLIITGGGGGGNGSGANVVSTYANGTLVVANANVNFNNTATVNVIATANGTNAANVSFTANGTALGIPAANANALAAYAQANNAYGQANLAYTAANSAQTSSNTVYGVANSAANTVATYANGTIVLVAANLNFNNTATVNVGASANGTGQSNVSFSANGTALGIPAINTALGTMNTQVTVAQNTVAVNANANSHALQCERELQQYHYSQCGYECQRYWSGQCQLRCERNCARCSSNQHGSGHHEYPDHSRTKHRRHICERHSDSCQCERKLQQHCYRERSNGANGTTQTNVAFTTNANAITGLITTANASNILVTYSGAGATIDTRLPPGGGGGGGAIYANGTLTLGMSNANVNFNNTATVNVATSANGATQVNVAFSANGTVLGIPAINTALGTMNSQVLIAQNTVATYQNGTIVLANANLNFNNSQSILISPTANGTTQSNLQFAVNSSLNLTSLNVSSFQISANGVQAILGAINLNFINSTSVNVSTTANGTTQANVAFAVNTTFVSGGVTAVNAANLVAVLANGTLTMANANINFNNTATVNVATSANSLGTFANVAFAVNVSSTDWASAANGTAQSAFSRANAFAVWANSGLILANSINLAFYNTATVNAVAVSNTPNGVNVSFSTNANAITGLITTANASNILVTYAVGGATIDTRVPAGTGGGGAIYANGTITLGMSNANVNFNNTATVNVATSANGSTQTNVAFTANGTALGVPAINTALGTMNTQITVAQNTVAIYANGTLTLANANVNFNNTATVNVATTANGTGQTNVAFTVNVSSSDWASGANGTAQSAFSRANAFAVWANSGLILANTINLALYNTATVNVVATSNTPNGVNVSFAANGTALGIPAINTALGTMNTQITVAQNTVAIYANGTLTLANSNVNFNNTATVNVATSANGTVQTNVAFTVNVSSSDWASGANSTAQSAFARANTFGVFANVGSVTTNTLNLAYMNTATVNVVATSNTPNGVNLQFSVNVSSSDWASAANGTAQSAFARANAFAVWSNAGLVLANSINLALYNTATVNVVATSNSPNGTNVAFSTNANAITGLLTTANASNILITYSGSGATIDTRLPPGGGGGGGAVYANGTLTLGMSNANVNFNNTGTINATATANGTTQVNVTFDVNGTALGVPAINTALGTMNTQITIAQNTVAIYANGTLTLANANVNFNNTSTVNVATTANGTTQTNVAFAANGTALGIPAINTALGTMNTQITVAQNTVAIYANGTLTLANSNVNFNNTSTVNVATSANGTVQTNVAFAANGTALGIPAINTALGTMNTQITVAQNTVAIYANGTLTLANSNVNFNNTATVNVATSANGTVQTNVAFSVNVSSSDWASGANGTAQSAYSRANSFAVWANSGLILANTINLAFYNTATVNAVAVSNTPNGTNVAFSTNANAITGLLTTANASNILITYSGSGATIDTRTPGGGGGGGGALYANGGLILGMSNANINFVNTATIVWALSANGSTQTNVSGTAVGSAPAAAGNTTELQWNNATVLSGLPNATFQLSSNTLNVWAVNVKSNLYVTNGNAFHGNTAYNSAAWSGSYYFFGAQSANNYGGIGIQNRYAAGANASADFVAISDDGSDTAFYIDMGINNSQVNDAGYPFLGRRDSYLIGSGNTINTSNMSDWNTLNEFQHQFHCWWNRTAIWQVISGNPGNFTNSQWW